MFGLKEAEVASLVRAVSADDLDRDGIAERFARATWTGIAEPGDVVAGTMIAALGPAAALEALVGGAGVDGLFGALKVASVEHARPERKEIEEAIARWQPRLASATALLALRQAARFGTRLLVPSEPIWPRGVDDLGLHAPLALWLRGTTDAVLGLDRSIALVGARAATGYGEHVAMEASAGLVDRGYAIVSGAAYGIDGMAHRAALASEGTTIAFLAGGLDRFYPSGHDALLARIVERGAVLSEVPCGVPPTKWRFLQRNRLIAASSLATVVLEAGWRSGSLNTAGHAAALGRPLGAVPGPVTSAASAGCHRLLREYDATCVTTAEEMSELAPLAERPGWGTSPGGGGPTAERIRLLDALSSRSPRDVADIAARSGLSIVAVQSELGLLGLEGAVREGQKGWTAAKKAGGEAPRALG